MIFKDPEGVGYILNNPDEPLIYLSMLKYGLSTRRFLFLDYKGEENLEIVNYILDYEFSHDIELATQDELEELGDYDYKYVPEKIQEANKLIKPKGYGLFSFPTPGDFYALFLAELEHKDQLLQVELLADENIPVKERYIQYYTYV
ncbi:hypothetical protein J25TS5_15960 [Paenibacillus faecis]|nr:hypothetical protein [Paenibacillus faecis]GIO84664.1 hypothetical protein J25TS5_15960 [Paenibacillus faecis]